MTSEEMTNSPSQWLGIPSGDWPVNHYRLLDVAMFEGDPQVIVQACAKRSAEVSAHLHGGEADAARKLLSDLAAAQSCLLDPHAKAAYDDRLRRQSPSNDLPSAESNGTAQSTAASSSAAGFKRPAPRSDYSAAMSGAGASPSMSATTTGGPPPAVGADPAQQTPREDGPPPKVNVEEPTSALPWLIGGVCAGLLGVCVLAIILLLATDRRQTADADSDRQPASANASSDSQGRGSHGTRTTLEDDSSTHSPTSLPSDTEEVVPVAVAPDPLTWDREPDELAMPEEGARVDPVDEQHTGGTSASDSPAGDEVAAPQTVPIDAQPKSALASLPRTVALPRRSADGAPHVLTRIDADEPRDVQLQLLASELPGGSGHFELAPRTNDAEGGPRTWDVHHLADGGPPQTVGRYVLNDGELSFQWADDTPEEKFTQLENVPLRVKVGDDTTTLAQRVPDTATPLIVKVDAGAVSTAVPISNPPENADVMVAIENLSEKFGDYAFDNENIISVGKTTNLQFGGENDPFQFALQISAEQAGPNRVRIAARPMFRENGTKKWDYFRPKEATQTLNNLQQQQAVMDAQFQQLQKRLRNRVARDQAAAVHNRQSAALLESIASLQRISERCQQLQDQAELHFRVFADAAGEQIDLVRTADAAPDSSTDSADENIGPPVDSNIGAPAEPGDEPPAAEDEEAPPVEAAE